ncbi:MAG: class I SAM-dependent methyltransferase [Pseudomonadota bacterium]
MVDEIGHDAREQRAEHWDAYWRRPTPTNAADSGAVTGPRQAQFLAKFWADFFASARIKRNNLPIADLACGTGAISHVAPADIRERIIGIDYAASGACAMALRGGMGVVASVDAAPIPDRACAAIVSQFGVEYAGAAAFPEAARILSRGGALGVVSHMRDGVIDQECASNARITRSILNSDFFASALAVLAGGGDGSAAAFDAATGALKIQAAGFPDVAASKLASQLLQDGPRLIERRVAYNAEDLRQWFSGMEQETALYLARMKAMCAAALSDTDVDKIVSGWRADGLECAPPRKMKIDEDARAFAWRLEARRL